MSYHPQTYQELKELCDDPGVSLAEIDPGAVTDMHELFADSKRSAAQFAGIEDWDVSQVTHMNRMFEANETTRLSTSPSH